MLSIAMDTTKLLRTKMFTSSIRTDNFHFIDTNFVMDVKQKLINCTIFLFICFSMVLYCDNCKYENMYTMACMHVYKYSKTSTNVNLQKQMIWYHSQQLIAWDKKIINSFKNNSETLVQHVTIWHQFTKTYVWNVRTIHLWSRWIYDRL